MELKECLKEQCYDEGVYDKGTDESVVRYENEWEPDAHSCRANADSYGICSVCSAIVSGTMADYEFHGYDPPGTV